MQVSRTIDDKQIRKTLLFTLPFSALFLMIASVGQAGECPSSKVVDQGQQPGATAHKDVTDTVIGSIDLSREKPGLQNTKFRLRRLVVKPGGEVAWHSHADRPAIIYVVSGTITEYRSTCAVPIKHRAGEVAIETHQTSHWWKNKSGRPVILLSTDILQEGSDAKTM